MLKRFVFVLAVVAGAFVSVAAQAADAMKPFILASNAAGDQAAMVEEVKAKAAAGGFEVLGAYTPFPGTTIVGVTRDALKAAAAKTEFGAYGAAQRISVVEADGKIQVSYTNPSYMAAAYRMDGDLADVTAAMAAAFGTGEQFGPKDAMTDADLRGYHYMFGMEYFDDPHKLNSFGSYQEAVDAVEKGLAAGTSGITKVWRVDVPGKEETVFAVGMKGPRKGDMMQDDTFIMSEIDFKPLKSAAHLPYEIVVSGDTAYALSARFRIAINYPDLSMMGDNSFMNIMGAPDAIRAALTAVAGGSWKK